eukprot:9595-Pelagococcus_subviridis.AAC.1
MGTSVRQNAPHLLRDGRDDARRRALPERLRLHRRRGRLKRSAFNRHIRRRRARVAGRRPRARVGGATRVIYRVRRLGQRRAADASRVVGQRRLFVVVVDDARGRRRRRRRRRVMIDSRRLRRRRRGVRGRGRDDEGARRRAALERSAK